MLSAVNGNNPNFKAGYHVYFYTDKGKRIVSDENMKKCLHYMEAHLNGSKRVKVRNQELIDTFKFGKKLPNGEYSGGDKDYYNIPKIRSVIDNTKDKIQGFMNIVSGKDVDIVENEYGKKVGKAKHVSLKRTGSTDSFETSQAVTHYIKNAPEYAETKAVYKNGERQAFGIAFTPQYTKNGKLKGFEYHHCGFFDESKVK